MAPAAGLLVAGEPARVGLPAAGLVPAVAAEAAPVVLVAAFVAAAVGAAARAVVGAAPAAVGAAGMVVGVLADPPHAAVAAAALSAPSRARNWRRGRRAARERSSNSLTCSGSFIQSIGSPIARKPPPVRFVRLRGLVGIFCAELAVDRLRRVVGTRRGWPLARHWRPATHPGQGPAGERRRARFLDHAVAPLCPLAGRETHRLPLSAFLSRSLHRLPTGRIRPR